MLDRQSTIDFHIEAPSVVSLGKFDGLHSGHRYLMEEVMRGKENGLDSVVFTFDIPPASLHSDSYSVLSTNEEKLEIFEEAHIDHLIECPFNDKLRVMLPYEFLKMMTGQINVKKIVCGTDFHFGYKRSGSYEDLLKHSSELGYEAVIVKKKQYKGADISSTRIRKSIMEGDMEEANLLLGYDYFISEEVVHGNHLGTGMGIPTANILPPKEKLLPPAGVYAAKVRIADETFRGICDIGRKPTIEGSRPVGVEVHIFDFSRDIYGQKIKVSLLKYMRPEIKFDSMEELAAQMQRDIRAGRLYAAEHR